MVTTGKATFSLQKLVTVLTSGLLANCPNGIIGYLIAKPENESPSPSPNWEVTPGVILRRRGTKEEYIELVLPRRTFEVTLHDRETFRATLLGLVGDTLGIDPKEVPESLALKSSITADFLLASHLIGENFLRYGASSLEAREQMLDEVVEVLSRGQLRITPESVPETS